MKKRERDDIMLSKGTTTTLPEEHVEKRLKLESKLTSTNVTDNLDFTETIKIEREAITTAVKAIDAPTIITTSVLESKREWMQSSKTPSIRVGDEFQAVIPSLGTEES